MSTPPDPMKGFRGVMSAVLILEALVLLLSLLVLAKSDDAWASWLVAGLAIVMIGACAFVGRPWGLWFAVSLQVVMAACVFFEPVLGGLGIAFGAVWAWMVWLRRDVARRMAAGTLRSQQPPS